MSPQYFRRLATSRPHSRPETRTSSPTRRLVGSASAESDSPKVSQQEWPASPPAFVGTSTTSDRISSSAYSQGYFKRFFRDEGVLGRGGKGIVLLVAHYLDNVFLGNFACKRVPVGDNHRWLERVLMEVSLLQDLSHQNLVSYRHVWLENFQASPFGPSTPHVFILQQYCVSKCENLWRPMQRKPLLMMQNSGTLFDHVLGPKGEHQSVKEHLKHQVRDIARGGPSPTAESHRMRRMLFDEIFSFFRDITAGLAHLHANGYVHRDLKPQNCLLHLTPEGSLRVLVSDFGEMAGAGADRGPNATGFTGTIAFAAPEVLQMDRHGELGRFTDKSDVFSLGQITYFMCFNRLPYRSADLEEEEEEDLSQLKDEIVAWTGLKDERKERSDLPDRLYRFLTLLLSYNPEDRPSTEEILRATRPGSGFNEYTTPSAKADDYDLPMDSSQPSSPIDGPRLKRWSFKPERHKPNKRASTDASFHSAPLPSPRKTSIKSGPSEPGDQLSDMVLRSHGTEDEWVEVRQGRPLPLLIAPPRRTLLQTVEIFVEQRETVAGVKLLLFTAKVWSLMWPCSPLAPSPILAYPLLVLAAADLLRVWGPGGTLALLMLHVAALLPAWKSNRICHK